jgi:hypothetical protein
MQSADLAEMNRNICLECNAEASACYIAAAKVKSPHEQAWRGGEFSPMARLGDYIP